MEPQYHSDEIDFKRLAKRVLRIFTLNKKKFIGLLVIFLSVAAAFFINVTLKPSYKAELILKTRVVKKDQLDKIIEKHNGFISNANLNPIDAKTAQYIRESRIFLTSIKENEVDAKDKSDPYKLYTYRVFFESMPEQKMIDSISILLSDIQSRVSMDNEITQSIVYTEKQILELDSLLNVAYGAGNSYKSKLEGGHSGQLLVMNDLYKGINELLSQKVNLEKSLKMYRTENIIFQTSPVILSEKTKYPVIFFIIGFVLWLAICSLWIATILLFGEESE